MKRLAASKWVLLATVALTGVLVLAACSEGSSATPTSAAPGGGPAGVALLPSGEAAARLAALSGVGGSQQLGVWVNGSGVVTARPDVGILAFSVEARADQVAPARAEAAAAMDAVMRTLRANGVRDRDIQTQQFRIQPITVFRQVIGREERIPEIVGYIVTNSASAKIRDIDSIGAVIDDAAEAGGDAIRINSIGFTIDDPKPLETQARELALTDAMTKAQQIAQVTGVPLGDPLFISESGGSPVVAAQALRLAPSAAFDVETPISPGESRITVRVQMVFPIQ